MDCVRGWGRLFLSVILILPFITVGSIHVVAAETDGLDKWKGLWCSGRDEIGVYTRADLGPHAVGQTASLYVYVRLNLGEANDYTVQGFVTPFGDNLELADGECRIGAEMHGAQMLVTDNHRCDKISGTFQHREFNRIKKNLVFDAQFLDKEDCN